MTHLDGKFIHRWVPGTNLRGPTLLLLHGTGGAEHDLVDLGHSLVPGANLLSPRGQVNENGMARYFRRLAEGVFDLEDLRFRTAGLAEFVAASAVDYGFDADKVVAVGFSNGANIAASLLLSGSQTLAGAVLLHPMVPFEPTVRPDLDGVSVFVGAGQTDPLVPVAQTQRLIQLLTEGGATVETHWQPGGHKLTRDEIEAAKLWLNDKGEKPWN